MYSLSFTTVKCNTFKGDLLFVTFFKLEGDNFNKLVVRSLFCLLQKATLRKQCINSCVNKMAAADISYSHDRTVANGFVIWEVCSSPTLY